MERRIRPSVPARAATMEQMENIRSHFSMLRASTPLCRSHRSDAKERSRKTVVTTQPAIKRGFRPSAPTSEMYLWRGVS